MGTVAELPSVSWPAEDRLAAFVGVEEIVAEMLASDEEPPVAIADKHYSGSSRSGFPKKSTADSRSAPQSRAFH